MNENVIDGTNGAFGTFEDVNAYGGQWHLGASATTRTIIRHGQVSRQDWYTPANATPRGQLIVSSNTGYLIDGDWDVTVFPPGADRPQNWNNLSVGSATTTYSGPAHENLGIRAQCWNTGTDTQSANEVCVGGRSDGGAGTIASRNILEFTGMLGRGAPVPSAANNFSLTNLAGTDTDITGGPSTGTGLGGGINFYTSTPTGSSATVNTGAKRASITASGNFGFTSGKGQHFTAQAANNDLGGVCSGTVTTCAVTFTTNYTSTPACIVTPTTAGVTSAIITTQANSGFTVTYAPSGTTNFNYVCLGNPN
jgi:hypothetical protein